MLSSLIDGLNAKLPAGVMPAYAAIVALGLGIGFAPLFRTVTDINACQHAMAAVNDHQSFDLAYAECEARGIVQRER